MPEAGERGTLPGGPRTASPRRRGGAWLARVGIVMIVVGAIVLGWVAWQFWGTNWAAQRKQGEAVEQLHDAWERGEDAAVLDFGRAEAIVRIPAFGADYAIPVLAGTTDEVLRAGFGHFAGSVGPGEVGNFALAGHRVTHGEPLRRMPELEVGDEVIVETRDTAFTYTLVTGGDDLVVSFDQTWVVDALPNNPDEGGVEPPQEAETPLLTLTTCAELFHTSERLIAFATLTSAEPR